MMDAPLSSDAIETEIRVLFAVIVEHPPSSRGSESWRHQERRSFLEALGRSGQLVLEGTFGEHGSLMLIEAGDTSDALALVQNDPCVLGATKVIQIQPLALNLVGNLQAQEAAR